ncbi:AEC family transporter [Aestuariibius sp. HNIBRBA575]|uniref:AEC family transporter n=1 Tax=Aestuariibius sp. HNIBRBA575 TaxID=3233343 RepID=UPI0034A378FE
MLDIFLQTLPFFALIGLGYGSGVTGFFPAQATAYLTRFVFYFALSAMLFKFSANLSLAEIWSWPLVLAYLSGSIAIYLIATIVGFMRGLTTAEVAFEAQCAVIGNTGFLGIPMLVLLLGTAAIGPVMIALAIDLIVFGSLVVILVTGSRDGRMSPAIFKSIGLGLIKNPMIVSTSIGLLYSASGLPIPAPVNSFVTILGAAATPGALFAIGASLATITADRIAIPFWLTFAKLVLHPAAIAIATLMIFPVAPYQAGVVIAAAALPVAGNVYIMAQHYNVAPGRVSASILISTAISIITVSMVIAWVTSLTG